MAGWIKMLLGKKVGLGPGDIVLDGDQASPQKGHGPQFLSHVRCSQTTAWIKTPLGMEVGLGPGHCVRWGPAQKGAQPPPMFGPCLLWPNGWMD